MPVRKSLKPAHEIFLPEGFPEKTKAAVIKAVELLPGFLVYLVSSTM
jgi:hypothetical protein